MNRKTRLALVLMVLSLVGATQACSRPGLRPPLPITTAPASSTPPPAAVPFDQAKLSTVERNITYCTMDGISLKLDVYYPSALDGAWPVVMYVHGGAWVKGDKSEGRGSEISLL